MWCLQSWFQEKKRSLLLKPRNESVIFMFTDFFIVLEEDHSETWKNVSCMCVDQICLWLLYFFYDVFLCSSVNSWRKAIFPNIRLCLTVETLKRKSTTKRPELQHVSHFQPLFSKDKTILGKVYCKIKQMLFCLPLKKSSLEPSSRLQSL